MNNIQTDLNAWFTQAGKDLNAGNLDSAETLYRKILTYDAGHFLTLYNLAFTVYKKGGASEAVDLFRQALAANPGSKEAHYNLAIVLQNLKRFAECKAEFVAALAIDKDYYDAHVGLAGLFRDLGDFDRALESYNRAAGLRENADILYHVGYVYQLKGMFVEAGNFYKKALIDNPRHLGALNNLGTLYSQIERLDEAQQLFERSLAVDPRNVNAINNMGRIYKSLGLLDKSIEFYRRGLAIKPDHVPLHNNLLMSMVYASSVSPEELVSAAREFGQLIGKPLMRSRAFSNDSNPDRKLRIGYVSGDLRRHSVSFFLEPLAHYHDRALFEVYAYSNNIKNDEATDRIKGAFDHWREIRGKTDEDVVAMIEADRIDILIDVSGHTEGNRLTVFARKAAPIQISWLGYPATTGLAAIDYRIVDRFTDPEGMTEQFSVEKLWRLPEIFCCYGEPRNSPAVIKHPPCEDNGYITFGCFNNFAKITDEVLSTWQKIMAQVPQSRLLLEIAGLNWEKFRLDVEARIEKAGLPMERVILEPRKSENQFKLYNRIDIALDPFPCNGGTTSMDTLWMGVPFITLEGRHFVSRMGVTILSNADMHEFIAKGIDEYIDKAVALATDRDRLVSVREGLRSRVKSSPLMDQRRFAGHMDNAYRQMWRDWSAQE